jgi:hypothetical protein
MKSKKTKDDCTELKNIKYQNMLLSNSKVTEDVVENINNIEQFLTNEKKQNKNKPWNKIGKTKKIKIINEFIKTYSKTKKLSKIKTTALKNFLSNCIDRKKLQKIKDVNYNKEKEIINEIPNLNYNENTKKFFIRKNEKKMSTLKHLAPKSKKKKIRSKKTEKQKSKSKKNKLI